MKKQTKTAKKPVTNVKKPSAKTVTNKGNAAKCKGGACKRTATKKGAK